MVVIGYILGLFIGMVLGLFGSGGAIISFPVLVYFMDIPPEQASIYSLIVVGIASVAGSVKYIKDKEIDMNIVLVFIIPVFISFYIVRQWILPAIPSDIIRIENYSFTKNNMIMFLFIITLSFIIYKMFALPTDYTNNLSYTSNKKFSLKYFLTSFLVGALSASIGAGGGFIIVPALVIFYHLPIKKATGTSLLIISATAIFGSFINRNSFSAKYVEVIVLFSLIAIIGMFIGIYLNKNFRVNALKNVYGYFLISILFGTIIAEIYKNLSIH